jgi:NAD+ synthase (glutamine-hydrolysing)
MDSFDFLRISVASPPIHVADASANAEQVVEFAGKCSSSDLVLFPELCLSGYSCGDLFAQEHLIDACLEKVSVLCDANRKTKQIWVLGIPLLVQEQLYNCAIVICDGHLKGIVPKTYLPTYQEFYEARWFQPSTSLNDQQYNFNGTLVPIGTDLLFQAGEARIGVEICEDLWMPVPPSSLHALAGANVLLNLSASNETVGKADWRRQLVSSQAGRCVAAYAYSSCGPTESTTDIVFGGHCMINELGTMLAESHRVGTDWHSARIGTTITADVDLHRIRHDRQVMQTSLQGSQWLVPVDYRVVECALPIADRRLDRRYKGQPFVPKEDLELANRCKEIVQIQMAALARRLQVLPPDLPLSIGVSGGLDSTLALLIAAKACDDCIYSRKRILGLTMPGFGTSNKTQENATRLMQELDVAYETTDICSTCVEIFRGMGHKPFGISLDGLDIARLKTQLSQLTEDNRHDLVFENVQARTRTLLLMNRGFVLGTGDLSESALGWSTYNGDHMSMYNVNCSIPKTLVRFLVKYLANHEFKSPLREILLDIADTPISPELLPLAADGAVIQETEGSVGPYELHDFFLYHFIRTGAAPQRLLFLAAHAEFSQPYSPQLIESTLKTFLTRFFANQFKRTCVPDGPKVGTVSLSPRGDWRMPSDVSAADFLLSLNKST